MNKIEFEQEFLKILREKAWCKSPKNRDFHENLKNYLKFIDEHKIYEYVSYEQLIGKIKVLEFFEDEQGLLAQLGAGAFYDQPLKWIVHPTKNEGKFNRFAAETLIHELTHALSATEKKSYDCDYFEKQKDIKYFTNLPHSIFKKSLTEVFGYELSEEEEQILIEHLRKNPDVISNFYPVRNTFYTGLTECTEECNQYVDTKTRRRAWRNLNDYINSEIHGNFPHEFLDHLFASILSKYELTAINEGITELIANLIVAKSNINGLVRPAETDYTPLTALATQLYCIFGEKLFESYFTNTTRPMIKCLSLKEDEFNGFLSSISDILDSPEELSQVYKLTNDKQIEMVKLFERKMLREIAKYQNEFTSPKYMHFAIESSFVDFAKHLTFGDYAYDKDWNRVYAQMEKSIKNCLEFGNKLLQRRGLAKMPAISFDIRQKFVEQTYNNYLYIGKNTQEITLSNRLVPFEQKNQSPTEKNFYQDSWMYIGKIRPEKPFYSISKGGTAADWKKYLLDDPNYHIDGINPKPQSQNKSK